MPELTHQPKGRMCLNCVRVQFDCAALPFEQMPVLKTADDGVKVVRCTEFVRTPKREVPDGL